MNIKHVTQEWLQKEYQENQRSFQDIAEELKTYPNAVRRRAIKFGIKPRDKSEAQSAALKSERHGHPTKGRQRPDSVKLAISEGVSKSWDNLSEDKYEERVEQGRKQWESLTVEQRQFIQKKATDAVRKTSKEGSKLEKFLVEHLKNAGFMIEFHKKGLLANSALEVDIFLPGHNIAIEVDGPSHFIDLWNTGNLGKVQKADNEKNGLLLLFKINVVRVKQMRRNLSDKNMRDTASLVQSKIDEILKAGGEASIYEVEVN